MDGYGGHCLSFALILRLCFLAEYPGNYGIKEYIYVGLLYHLL